MNMTTNMPLVNYGFSKLEIDELREVNGGGVIFVCLVMGVILLLGFAMGYVLAIKFG